jgi:hypothetical protein
MHHYRLDRKITEGIFRVIQTQTKHKTGYTEHIILNTSPSGNSHRTNCLGQHQFHLNTRTEQFTRERCTCLQGPVYTKPQDAACLQAAYATQNRCCLLWAPCRYCIVHRTTLRSLDLKHLNRLVNKFTANCSLQDTALQRDMYSPQQISLPLRPPQPRDAMSFASSQTFRSNNKVH